MQQLLQAGDQALCRLINRYSKEEPHWEYILIEACKRVDKVQLALCNPGVDIVGTKEHV